jgi:GGDEF domain-containing protein
LPEDIDSERAVHRADEGLYAAKAAGRNCLMVCPAWPVNV